ncbi:unnamed protein product [Owenia fusiformis]|uniref:Acyl-coenzyme A thioesterase 13 n=1 Tax=Owenia fusiformis TaxID=6347 RepID=A0A8J1XYQ1_OWEFU|nr:unnamed protein product [Owenia fusiformis]
MPSTSLVRQLMQFMTKERGFDTVMKGLRVVSAGNGNCVCELTVTEDEQNRGGSLHGGMTATLVDVVSTCALMTTERQVAGVSVDMNITYMKGAKVGSEIVIDAKTLRCGSTLAFLSVDITHKADGTFVAQGRHTKFIGSKSSK